MTCEQNETIIDNRTIREGMTSKIVIIIVYYDDKMSQCVVENRFLDIFDTQLYNITEGKDNLNHHRMFFISLSGGTDPFSLSPIAMRTMTVL